MARARGEWSTSAWHPKWDRSPRALLSGRRDWVGRGKVHSEGTGAMAAAFRFVSSTSKSAFALRHASDRLTGTAPLCDRWTSIS